MKDVILSIHPKYAKAIYEGRKHWEFRTKPPQAGGVAYLYETAPVCRVTGALGFSYAVSGVPEYVWEVIKSLDRMYGARSNKPGISKDEFLDYAKDSETVTALRIEIPLRWDAYMPLPPGIKPPQNWIYWP